jgi:hypothetical protein
MSVRTWLLFPVLAAVLLLAVASAPGQATAAQPVNRSFEQGLTGWTQSTTGGASIQVVPLSPFADSGAFGARLGGGAGRADLSQVFYMAAGETIGGYVGFEAGEPCDPETDDWADLYVDEPSSTRNHLFIASNCSTGGVAFTTWSFTATKSGYHTLAAVSGSGISGTGESLLYVDAPISPPRWVVSAKVGGGNMLNPNLPDYVLGTWSRKFVTIYIDCVAGDAPLVIERADRAVTLKDGAHRFASKPTDECIDANGASAPPVLDFGWIAIDTKAPVCSVASSTVYVPRGQTAQAAILLNITDEMSGVSQAQLTANASGGAVLNGSFLAGSLPGMSANVDVTMPDSTTGRVDLVASFTDHAGNTGSCKLTVRAR